MLRGIYFCWLVIMAMFWFRQKDNWSIGKVHSLLMDLLLCFLFLCILCGPVQTKTGLKLFWTNIMRGRRQSFDVDTRQKTNTHFYYLSPIQIELLGLWRFHPKNKRWRFIWFLVNPNQFVFPRINWVTIPPGYLLYK